METRTPKSEPCLKCGKQNFLYDLMPYCPECIWRREDKKAVPVPTPPSVTRVCDSCSGMGYYNIGDCEDGITKTCPVCRGVGELDNIDDELERLKKLHQQKLKGDKMKKTQDFQGWQALNKRQKSRFIRNVQIKFMIAVFVAGAILAILILQGGNQ